VVGDELGGEGEEDRGQEAVGLGDDQVVVDVGAEGGVLGGDGDGAAATGGDFVDVVDHHRFVAGGGDENYGIAVVHGRQRAMLELTGKDTLAVGIGDFLQLEGTFESDGMAYTKSEVVWDRTD